MTVRILLAEADSVERNGISSELERAGFEVAAVEDGDHLLAHLAADKPDLVICASELPDIRGADLVTVIRAKAPTLPIVVISREGFSSPDAATSVMAPHFRIDRLHRLFPAMFPTLPRRRSVTDRSLSTLTVTAARTQLLFRAVRRIVLAWPIVSGLLVGILIGAATMASVMILWPESQAEIESLAGAEAAAAADADAKDALQKKALRTQIFSSYRKKDYVEVVQVGTLLLETEFLDWEAQWVVAQSRDKAGLAEEAIKDFIAFADDYPDNKFADDAQFRAAELLRARGKNEQARKLYEQVAQNPNADFREQAQKRLEE